MKTPQERNAEADQTTQNSEGNSNVVFKASIVVNPSTEVIMSVVRRLSGNRNFHCSLGHPATGDTSEVGVRLQGFKEVLRESTPHH